MNRRFLVRSSAALAASVALPQVSAAAPALDPKNIIDLDLTSGRISILLLPQAAPRTVERIKTLARRHFYDRTPFHRVIPGFMAQGGDPTGTGSGGSNLPNIPLEVSSLHFVRGTCGMARRADPNSGNSQFFIMFAPAPSLDGQYTIWGRVIRGMDLVDRIKRGTGPNGEVLSDPDRIVRMRVASDVRS